MDNTFKDKIVSKEGFDFSNTTGNLTYSSNTTNTTFQLNRQATGDPAHSFACYIGDIVNDYAGITVTNVLDTPENDIININNPSGVITLGDATGLTGLSTVVINNLDNRIVINIPTANGDILMGDTNDTSSASKYIFNAGNGTHTFLGYTIIGGNSGYPTPNPVSLEVVGGLKVGDLATAAASNLAGTFRYRTDANNSYCEMCMQTGAATWQWVIIKQNTW